MNSVTASVPRLSEEEMRAVHTSVERSLHEARRPLSAEEARTLIRQPRDAYEFFAYAESNLAHSICALKHLPEFRALALATQRAVVKVRACVRSFGRYCTFSSCLYLHCCTVVY